MVVLSLSNNMLKVYFKPTCSTCKTAVSLLKEETDEEIEYISGDF